MNVVLHHHKGMWPTPGTWRFVFDEGVRTARVACPACGMSASLRGTHQIDADGYVAPSLVCECGFHEHVRLDGWIPLGAVPQTYVGAALKAIDDEDSAGAVPRPTLADCICPWEAGAFRHVEGCPAEGLLADFRKAERGAVPQTDGGDDG